MSDFVNDWVRCNVCFKNFDINGGMLTSCGHFICNRPGCKLPESHGERVKCPVCKAMCGAVSLASALPNEILQFFEEPEQIMQKCVDILHFHNHQKELARRHFEDQSARLKELEDTIVELQAKNRELMDSLEKRQQPAGPRAEKKKILQECMIPGIIDPVLRKHRKEELFPISVIPTQNHQTVVQAPQMETEIVPKESEAKLFTPTLASRLQNLTGKKLYSPVPKNN